ncbi:MAG: methyltransferase domain-containing protein [Comamonadaceae bacterium]|nr:methyltransferase domain-containing protein [Comamonadaceae bacterium]
MKPPSAAIDAASAPGSAPGTATPAATPAAASAGAVDATRPAPAHIRAAFDRAAASYDAAAQVQRQAVQGLLAQLQSYVQTTAGPVAGPVLDAGSGTGYALPLLDAYLTAHASPSAPHLLALDAAPAMCQRSQQVLAGGTQRGASICADLHALPLAAGSVGLYWSSLAWQWCHAPTVAAQALRVLRPGGVLAVATLGPGTLGELAQAFAAVDAHRHVLRFENEASLRAALTTAGWVDVRVQRATLTAHYPNVRAVLHALKAVGANRVGPGARTTPLGRAGWARLEQAYERLRTAQGLPLSYQVIYLLARAPASTSDAIPAPTSA